MPVVDALDAFSSELAAQRKSLEQHQKEATATALIQNGKIDRIDQAVKDNGTAIRSLSDENRKSIASLTKEVSALKLRMITDDAEAEGERKGLADTAKKAAERAAWWSKWGAIISACVVTLAAAAQVWQVWGPHTVVTVTDSITRHIP